MERERVTVQEAAKRLGVTESAIRKRVQRGEIHHAKAENGRVYVYLDGTENDRDEFRDLVRDHYTRSLEDQIQFLRRELERKDAILLNMTEGLKALEAPREPRESTETATQEQEGVETPLAERRSWWQRFFFGP